MCRKSRIFPTSLLLKGSIPFKKSQIQDLVTKMVGSNSALIQIFTDGPKYSSQPVLNEIIWII
jgi:hypothetical protein